MIRYLLIALIPLMTAVQAQAQRPAGAEGPIPTIRERTAGLQKVEGLFNLYWDEKAERLWLEIEKLGTEFLYVTDLSSSIAGRGRGSWSGGQVVRFDRHGSRLFVTQVSYRYRAVTADAVERRAHWPRIVRLAEFPLGAVFRHEPSGDGGFAIEYPTRDVALDIRVPPQS